MITIKRSALFLILFICFSSLYAQMNDAGLWTSVALKKELNKKFGLSAESEIRLNNNISELRTAFVDLSGQYKLNDFMKIGLNYRFGNRKQLDNSLQIRQRWAFDLSFKTKFKELGIEYRSRFQQSIESLANGESDVEFNRTLRNKITLEHKVYKKTDADISAEVFSSKDEGKHRISDIRLSTGLSYKLKKRKIIKVGYLFQTQIKQANPERDYVILLGYSYEFK